MNQYEQDQENARIARYIFFATHPEYHLYRDLQESLPRFNRQVSKLEKIDWAEWEKKAGTI